ncbi:membrane protein insertase YidC [bacterium]|nr:membrane protein insertase YidC [bacterium]
MNIRDYILPLALALGTVFMFRHFWSGSSQDAGTSFVAPLTAQEQEPLRTEIDFIDEEVLASGQDVVVSTDYADFTFSSNGAVMSHATFKRRVRNEVQTFEVVGNPVIQDRQAQVFLVALDEKTPFNYTFEGRSDDDATIKIRYSAKTAAGTLEKEFVVHKDSYKIDLALTVSPHAGMIMRPRLLWPAPFLEVIKDEETLSAVIFDKAGSYSKKAEKSINSREGYFAPTMFGAEDKYFIHSMVEDVNQFTYRAYFKLVDKQIVSILEAQPVTETKKWTVSFYMGPKEVDTIAPVAPALEKVLDYGFFSPVAKGMLYLLKLCNNYVNNFGVAIILITLLLKLLLLPFTFKGEQKARKAEAYYKKLAYIQQKYKDDAQALNAARAELVQNEGVPGLGGCLPLFLQIPFFMGLSGALNNSIELYKAPFVFWIKDLSMKDPFYVLPVLIGVGFLLVMLSSKQNVNFKQFIQSAGMALLFAAWMSTTAAGLALFIVANVLLHFAQTRIQKAFGL